MTNGSNKDALRAMFKEANPDKSPLTKAGKVSKDYESFLIENCKPHWASVVSKFSKRVPEIDEGKIKASDALAESKLATMLQERCSLGIGGRLAKDRKRFEELYKIKF